MKWLEILYLKYFYIILGTRMNRVCNCAKVVTTLWIILEYMLQQCFLIFLKCRRIGFFSAIRCRRIGHLFAIKFHQNICVDSSTSTNWDVYESGQMLCRFVDIDESGCLRIGTNVVSIRRHRRIGMSTNLAICESICYRSTQTNVLGKNSCKFQKLLKTASKLIFDLKGHGG